MRAEPICSTCSAARPRRVTIWTATAPEAVRTLRTNRETTSEGLHARFVSDHFAAPQRRKPRLQPSIRSRSSGGTSQVKIDDLDLRPIYHYLADPDLRQ